MEWLMFGFGLLLCLGVLPGLLLGLVLGRASRKAPPAPEPDAETTLDLVAQQVDAWVDAERLPEAVAAQLYALIAADRAPALVAGRPAPVPPPLPVAPPEPTPIPQAAISPPASVAPLPPEPAVTPLPEPLPASGSAPAFIGAVPPTPVPPPRRRFLGALLALGTRRTLLYLGTFLLVLSGLTLIVFNWASFAPWVQTTLLAGITASIWGGGAWMTRRPDLARAGANLQAVAALLVPVVAFACTRPGMLDLAPRTGWLFVALACLPVYAVAAWHTRNSFYSGAAGLAGLNALLAGLGAVPNAWLPAWSIGLLTLYFLATPRLKALGRPDFAAGLYWTAQIGAPLAMLVASAIWFIPQASASAVAGAWAAAAVFYSVVTAIEDRSRWSWAAALIALIAVYANLHAWIDLGNVPLEAPAMAALAVIGVQTGLALRPRRPNIWLAPVAVALLPAALALTGAAEWPAAARFALPILIGGSFRLLRAARRGRLAGLPLAPAALDLAGFIGVVTLIPFWIAALLELAEPATGMFWMIMLALALLACAGAFWWPGRLRPAYDLTLQALGSLLMLVSSAVLLFEPPFWQAATLLLTVILTGQALLRRHWVWAALALGSAVLAGAATLERSAAAADLAAWQYLGLAYSAVYALGATLLRRRIRPEWIVPALLWAVVTGAATAVIAIFTLFDAPTAGACLTLAALGVLLVALSRLWREARLGYPAVVLLAAGVLTAAAQGFFSGWEPGGALVYIVLSLAVGFGAAGLFMRRSAPAFALPYELAALALITATPLATAGVPVHLTSAWALMAALYAVASERYRKAWFALAGWICLDMAAAQGMSWRFPDVPFAYLGFVLAGLAWVQGGVALIARPAAQANTYFRELIRASYVALTISSLAALALAVTDSAVLAIVAFVLLALLILIGTIVPSALAAWLALPLFALGLIGLYDVYGLALTTQLLLTTLVALGLTLGGWALARSSLRLARVWDAPLRFPPLGVGLLSGLALAGFHLWDDNPAGLSLALALWALLWLAGGLRERQPWAALPAAMSANLALLSALVQPATAFPFVLIIGVAFALAALESILAAVVRRFAAAPLARVGLPIYLTAAFVGALALMLALSAPERFAAVALGLALLLGVLTTVERREAGVWGALGLSMLSFVVWFDALGISRAWAVAWLPLALIAFVPLGLGLERLGFGFWRRPTTLGAAVAGGLAALAWYDNVAALSGPDFAQAALAAGNLGLLWATVAVRIRSLNLGYAVGAAFVAAALCRLADLGVAEPQWYVLPTGLYLLALAFGERHFQGRRRFAQLLEVVAALLILGTSFGQALRVPGGPGYEVLLFGEALVMIAYGVLLRLRVPFVMGVGFFVAASGWLALEVVRGFNQWVLLGIFGLLMIAAYVVLERHQERLVRLGRTWMLEIRSWA